MLFNKGVRWYILTSSSCWTRTWGAKVSVCRWEAQLNHYYHQAYVKRFRGRQLWIEVSFGKVKDRATISLQFVRWPILLRKSKLYASSYRLPKMQGNSHRQKRVRQTYYEHFSERGRALLAVWRKWSNRTPSELALANRKREMYEVLYSRIHRNQR